MGHRPGSVTWAWGVVACCLAVAPTFVIAQAIDPDAFDRDPPRERGRATNEQPEPAAPPRGGLRTTEPMGATRRGTVPAAATRAPITLDEGVSVNPAVLQDVEHNRVGLQLEDREAYFRVLDLARKVDAEALRDVALDYRDVRREADPEVAKWPRNKFRPFYDLFNNPFEYHGRPVTMHGYFRQLAKYDPGPVPEGLKMEFDHAYEGWLYTNDSQSNPAVVVFTDLPRGMPVGIDVVEEVEVTGYFFKMYGYRAHDTTRKAPLILAGGVRWYPSTKARPTSWVPTPGEYLVLAIVLLMVMFAVWHFGIQRAQHVRAVNRLRDATAPPADLSVNTERGGWHERSPLH